MLKRKTKQRKEDFIKDAQRFFKKHENIRLKRKNLTPIRLGMAEKQNYAFDLQTPKKSTEKIIVTCLPQKWKENKIARQRIFKIWHETMLHFHLAPKNYRKIFFFPKSEQDRKSIYELYFLKYSHFIPPDVEFWEYCEETKSAVKLVRNNALFSKRKTAKVWSLRPIYAALCVIGLALPYTQFLPWLLTHGLAARLFFSDMFANGIASAFALDVFVSYAVLCLFVLAEGARLRMKYLWLPITGALIFGVSFALPLFLYMRESQQVR